MLAIDRGVSFAPNCSFPRSIFVRGAAAGFCGSGGVYGDFSVAGAAEDHSFLAEKEPCASPRVVI